MLSAGTRGPCGSRYKKMSTPLLFFHRNDFSTEIPERNNALLCQIFSCSDMSVLKGGKTCNAK